MSKYLCILKRYFEKEYSTKLVYEGLCKDITITMGTLKLGTVSIDDVISEFEPASFIGEYDTDIVLGIIEADSESVASLMAKSKFRETIKEKPKYMISSELEIIDIDTITY